MKVGDIVIAYSQKRFIIKAIKPHGFLVLSLYGMQNEKTITFKINKNYVRLVTPLEKALSE